MTPSLWERIRAFFAKLFGLRENRDVHETAPAVTGDASAKFARPFTLTTRAEAAHSLLGQILALDCKDVDSPLGLMKKYTDVLNHSASHGDIDDKLDALFEAGVTPKNMNGYYHGVTISLKNGAAPETMLGKLQELIGSEQMPDPLQMIFGRLLSKRSPWAGKNFTKLSSAKLSDWTGGAASSNGEDAYLGINSFRHGENDVLNNLAGEVLATVIEMKEIPAPPENQRSWIYAKGGLFIAQNRATVDPEGSGREVMSLNYRYPALGNKLPNRLLIDEIVQIAEGLYLGKLFYATSLRHMSAPYDPEIADADYKYRCFGYFLLMDDSWLHEKNMRFPELTYQMADNLPQKFTTLRLIDDPGRDAICAEAGKHRTVLHYLKTLSDGVAKDPEKEARYFDKLKALFSLGEAPADIRGFLHGGVVAFRSDALHEKLDSNLLNDIWPAVRPFSPWSGKTFTPAAVADLKRYIGDDADYYKNAAPLILGANTYHRELGLSLGATAFIEKLTHIGMAVEYPDDAQANDDIYVKSFFFAAEIAKSIKDSKGDVLQFNYRWPGFHTMPPDNLCIDEIVRIAEGLYLGQLLYATQPALPFDPKTDPARYAYENFGYFMLMDDDWWAVKNFIRFDTEA